MHTLNLNFGFQFQDLYDREKLVQLDALFLHALKDADPDNYAFLLHARDNPEDIANKDYSEFLVQTAPLFEEFLASFFQIDMATHQTEHDDLLPLYECKRKFIQRYVLKQAKNYTIDESDGIELLAAIEHELGEGFTELGFAKFSLKHFADQTEDKLELAVKYALWAIQKAEREEDKQTVLFRQPKKLDFEELVDLQKLDGKFKAHHPNANRDGFGLTDQGMQIEKALDHAHYCIYCHDREKDSCSKGYKVKKPATDKPEDQFQNNELDIKLTGCPLEEKISEMNLLKSQGRSLAAFSVIMIDNPMVPATGHRICNECMKACIYQKQEPVDIPQIETRILKDILNLPWGFEIYSLLTRWNPLDIFFPVQAAPSGKTALVVGMGPAGFTLSHYLLKMGHQVVAIDGLKIEPLAEDQSGKTINQKPTSFEPIYDYAALEDNLDERVISGFGGVAEYGITSRWNKNYLKAIRITLERQNAFRLFGGVRFGGTITVDQAWDMGFDHIGLCMGAGKPRLINVPNQLAKGVRQASDFLMALQLTGAAKLDTLANLQIRLPVIVIGGGLTAMDTATEALAYYPRQVEKFALRYQQLVDTIGEDAVHSIWQEEEREIATEFLQHAEEIAQERQVAKAENRKPNFYTLLKKWGGVTIAYRRRLQDSPSYRLNHEEVELAFHEGIELAENLTPKSIQLDEHEYVSSLLFEDKGEGKEVSLPAKTVFVAAGTKPNIVLHDETKGKFKLDEGFFAAIDEGNQPIKLPYNFPKTNDARFLTLSEEDKRSVSFHGDLHPSYAGNVVKAMASVKHAVPSLKKHLDQLQPNKKDQSVLDVAGELLTAKLVQKNRLGPNILELVIHAPAAARAFQPGQFYRLQNFESHAKTKNGIKLVTEGLAMTGAWSDPEKGLLSTIILEMGASSLMCDAFEEGDPLILMGPSGEPTEIVKDKTVLLIGGGLGNAVLFSIGQALKANGCKVIYFAGYRTNKDRFKIDMIEKASDHIVWCCDEEPDFSADRATDTVFHGNMIEALTSYCTGDLSDHISIDSQVIDHILTIGSDGLMAAVGNQLQNGLKSFFKDNIPHIASINSPMQCMMKEICAQCLQRHVDPETGEETVVFSCTNQDQNLKTVDFHNLRQRLSQNSVQEKLTLLWAEQNL